MAFPSKAGYELLNNQNRFGRYSAEKVENQGLESESRVPREAMGGRQQVSQKPVSIEVPDLRWGMWAAAPPAASIAFAVELLEGGRSSDIIRGRPVREAGFRNAKCLHKEDVRWPAVRTGNGTFNSELIVKASGAEEMPYKEVAD